MYRKNANSWLKHWDFILLDLIFFTDSIHIFLCCKKWLECSI